jgi:hypothetical protein
VSDNHSQVPIQERYASQVSQDLERNRRQQEELKSQLEVLHGEESWLSSVVLTLTGAEPAGPPSTASAQYRRTPDEDQPHRTTDAEVGHARGSRPPLGEIIWQVLSAHEEPQTVTAMHREVTELHPDRAASPQVVRNALETLVAKGRVKRRKEQRNVTYAHNLAETGEKPGGLYTT